MIEVGITDIFERNYMQKFRAFAGQFGEFVTYERDRGARDLGLHLTHKLASGKERLSSALCWFQMKGVMVTTLSAKELEKTKEVKLSLDVNHLRYWYLQPMPTYLVVYVESVDTFLIINIQDYVAEKWGKSILEFDQKTTTIVVSGESILDKHAFNLILVKSDIEEWAKALEADKESVRLCRRDFDLIWHFGSAQERGVEHRVIFMDWQSKTRSQFYIQERSASRSGEWEDLREHWQYMMTVFDLEEAYSYIEFFSLNNESEESWIWDEEEPDEEVPNVQFKNGDSVSGVNCSYEYFKYLFGAKLNEMGIRLFESVATLVKVGLIEITLGKHELISVAPWHRRAV
jgi:hypothetical protein